jgi:hypothetical protein
MARERVRRPVTVVSTTTEERELSYGHSLHVWLAVHVEVVGMGVYGESNSHGGIGESLGGYKEARELNRTKNKDREETQTAI